MVCYSRVVKTSGEKPGERTERPMPDAPACRGRDGAGCGFGATRQLNYTKKKAGVVTATYHKRLCKRCNDGKRPASRSPSPQRRPPVQRATNCFGGDANAVSHRQVGRGRAPEGASWTGSQHEFDNPTSEDATAYSTQRNGGSRKYHWWSESNTSCSPSSMAYVH